MKSAKNFDLENFRLHGMHSHSLTHSYSHVCKEERKFKCAGIDYRTLQLSIKLSHTCALMTRDKINSYLSLCRKLSRVNTFVQLVKRSKHHQLQSWHYYNSVRCPTQTFTVNTFMAMNTTAKYYPCHNCLPWQLYCHCYHFIHYDKQRNDSQLETALPYHTSHMHTYIVSPG